MKMKIDKDSLLLILPLPVHREAGQVFIEPQAANGLIRWLDNFERVTVCLKLVDGPAAPGAVPLSELATNNRLSYELFDPAWAPPTFLRSLWSQMIRIRELIERHRYLHFAIGGFWGDWAAVGALNASQMGRKFSIWTDRVESKVMSTNADRTKGLKRTYRKFNSWSAYQLEKKVIRLSALGLFHGQDTFAAYSRFSTNPHLVHNIHTGKDNVISPAELQNKVNRIGQRALKFVYAGRMHPDKGPDHWIAALDLVRQAGVEFEATWYGSGPMDAEMRHQVYERQLNSSIHLPGQLSDRETLLTAMRDADLMVFCHLTPESPRCLIEALIVGTPIVGYRSDHSADLIAKSGGGVLTEMAPAALAAAIIEIASDRARLGELVAAAARDGEDFNDESVFQHRSKLMKTYT